jgi:hypothetical protein
MGVPSNRPAAWLSRSLLIAACAVALTGTSAEASTVTIGSPLTAAFVQAELNATTTLVNSALPEPGARLVSPVTGAVVGWRIKGQGGPWRLRVLTPKGGTSYEGAGTSASQELTGAQPFATNLPIKAGQTIGVENLGNAHIGLAAVSEASYVFMTPAVADGKEAAGTKASGDELAFNADIQPAPTVTLISPTSGPTTGGTGVTISGTDFSGVTGVSFGAKPASGFTVESEGKLTAVAPAAPSAEAVDISVTTIAGTSAPNPADRFQYLVQGVNGPPPASRCVVPALKGKKLKAARKKLKAAGCTLGKVSGHKSKTAKVTKQSPKPGRQLASGGKVNVKVG